LLMFGAAEQAGDPARRRAPSSVAEPTIFVRHLWR